MPTLHLKPKITKVSDQRLALLLCTAQTLGAVNPSALHTDDTPVLIWSTKTKKANPSNLIINPHFKE